MKHVLQFYKIGLIILIASCAKKKSLEKSIPCIPTNLQNSIIAFYPFSNGSINDFSGNNNHLFNNTTATSSSDRNGNSNCAFEFNNMPSSVEFLTTSNTTFLNNLDKFSVSLWYQPIDTSRNGEDFEALINRGTGMSCPDRLGQWSIGLYDCRKAVFGRNNSVWDNNLINSDFDCQQEINSRTNQWVHLVVTFNQSQLSMSIYRNGVLQNSKIGNSNCGISSTPTVQDIGDLFIGKNYTGKIDDLILFNKVLTQQEINTLFNLETCCGE